MIKSFRSKETERLHARQRVKKFRGIERVAQRKLRQLDIATELRDLASPPGNRLEALKGEREGQRSIRINDQWRICFVWQPVFASPQPGPPTCELGCRGGDLFVFDTL